MGISIQELIQTAYALKAMSLNTPWYKPLTKFRLNIMAETLWGIIDHIRRQPQQRSCGCATHTNPGAN